jgi:protoporphyrinogen oxidase
LQRSYGDVLYKIFFKDYITKVWGYTPKQMAPSFAKERIPKMDVLAVLTKIKNYLFPPAPKTISTENYVEKVEGENYTTTKGFFSITEAYAQELVRLGGTLLLEHELTSINLASKKVTSITYKQRTQDIAKTLACDYFISTIPVSIVPRLMNPMPTPTVLEAAKDLKFRGILFVGLLIKKPRVLPASFMYFREKSFNRITDLALFKVEIKPPGSTLLVAEVMCNPGDPEWINEAASIQTVIDELIEEKLITREDVLEAHPFKTEYGYPIYKLGYEKAFESIFSEFSSFFKMRFLSTFAGSYVGTGFSATIASGAISPSANSPKNNSSKS